MSPYYKNTDFGESKLFYFRKVVRFERTRQVHSNIFIHYVDQN